MGTGFLIIIGVGILLFIPIFFLSAKEEKKTQETRRKAEQSRLKSMSNAEFNAYANKKMADLDKNMSNKPASVTKRAVAGTIIGGVPGAIIGAASAIDKNNKLKEKSEK